ncbi:hypothetical protein LCGC14_0545730 [marine sediment metagenome]|uniref:Methyltransferase type 12 domain-containing protein n=1 Tax=marine sediment metagenome TaxID=412755 RepID=A0A0F9UZP4_9ZZZZ
MKKTSQILSEVNSFWHSENNPSDYIRSFSHFQDYGKWKNKELWDKLGLDNLERLETLKMLSGKSEVVNMIEWGVGGGSNAVKFSKEIDFYGVDISRDSISECKRQLKLVHNRNFDSQLIHIQIENPELVPELIPKVDFFLCTSVFQHFPSPEYGANVAEIAYDILKDDGIALIQIKYGEHQNYFNYNENFARFTLYPIPLFWALMTQIGFKVLAITLETKTFYAYYYLKK